MYYYTISKSSAARLETQHRNYHKNNDRKQQQRPASQSANSIPMVKALLHSDDCNRARINYLFDEIQKCV